MFKRIGRVIKAVRKSLSNPTDLERGILGIRPSASGIIVTSRIAMQCTTVRACVEVISEAIGQLPIIVYKKDKEGKKTRDPDSTLYGVLHDQATEWLSATEFRELVTRDALLTGNGYALIEKDGDEVTSLVRLDPEKMKVDTDEYGDPFYKYSDDGAEVGYTFPEIFHIRAPSFDGYTGASAIELSKDAIGLAILLEQYGNRFFKNGAQIGGVIQHPAQLGDDVVERMAKSWNDRHSGENAGGVAILEEGATYQAVGMSSSDAQYLDLRRFAVEEICRVFRVPPIFVGDYGRATWGNSEAQGQQLVTYCLMPWIKRWEGEIRLKLIPEKDRKKVSAEFLIEDLLRADTAARYESYSKAIASKFMNPNEARERENLAPYEGGEKFENPNTSTAPQGSTMETR